MNRKASGVEEKEVIPDRDLTIPDWVDVPCPKCGAVLINPNANTVVTLAYPSISCKECDFSGPFEWVNPDSPKAYWDRRRALEGIPSPPVHISYISRDS
jgi:hypothetical protein